MSSFGEPEVAVNPFKALRVVEAPASLYPLAIGSPIRRMLSAITSIIV